jgi:hypothetical protein
MRAQPGEGFRAEVFEQRASVDEERLADDAPELVAGHFGDPIAPGVERRCHLGERGLDGLCAEDELGEMQTVEGSELLETVEAHQVSEGNREGADGRLGGERPLGEEGLGAPTEQPGPLVAAPGPPWPPQRPAVFEHQRDGVQAGATMTDVVAVMKRGPCGIEWFNEPSKHLPGLGRAPRDTSSGAIAAQALGTDGPKCCALLVAQRTGALEGAQVEWSPRPRSWLFIGRDGKGDGAHLCGAVVSLPVRRLMRQAWISAIPRLSLSERSRPERWM